MDSLPILCPGHSRPVMHFAYSPLVEQGDSETFWIISACLDGKPMLRNGETGDWVGTFEGHDGAVWSVDMDHLAMRCASASADDTARVWSALSGEELIVLEHDHVVRDVRFSRRGDSIATSSLDRVVRVFDLETQGVTHRLEGHSKFTKGLLWLQNDQILVSAGQDACLRVWDLRSDSTVKSFELGAPVSSLDFARNTVVATSGQTVTFFCAESWEITNTYVSSVPIESASLSPDGGFLVVGETDFPVRLLDVNDSFSLLSTCHGHHGAVHCVRFAPDQKSYASSSEDGTLRLWKSGLSCSESTLL